GGPLPGRAEAFPRARRGPEARPASRDSSCAAPRLPGSGTLEACGGPGASEIRAIPRSARSGRLGTVDLPPQDPPRAEDPVLHRAERQPRDGCDLLVAE